MKAAELEARIEVQIHKVADLDRHLGQIETTIGEAAKRGRTKTPLLAIEASVGIAEHALMSETARWPVWPLLLPTVVQPSCA
jgi:hypothetical protein